VETLNAEQAPIRLGVHELAAFVFCRRAGLLAFESKHEDEGHEQGLARLDFTHAYEFAELEQQLKSLLNWLLACVTALAAALVGWWFARDPLFVLGIKLLQLALVVKVLKLSWSAFSCYRKLGLYASVPPKSPDPTAEHDESVDWWSMRSAGFVAILPPGPFRDEEENLIGKPWRLLRHGSTLIPVFRANKPNNIKTQHRIRIAAYCQLVEHCEGSSSPYGIVLDPTGYAGMAIKITDTLQQELTQQLRRARQTISEAMVSSANEPPPPRNESKCKLCHYGELHKFDDGLHLNVRGEPNVVYSLSSPDGLKYHSTCGDRFHWRSPHKTLLERAWPG